MEKKITVKIADAFDREEIYKYRHSVYAAELHQHAVNKENRLTDDLDNYNTYIVAKIDGNMSGFVSITSPGGKYGLDKYVSRDKFPFIYGDMFEGRLFTVLKEYRGGRTALILFFAILRFAETNNGKKLMTYGRLDLVDFYKKTGLIDLEETISSGEVQFRLMYGEIKELRKTCGHIEKLMETSLKNVDNQLPFSMKKNTKCYHGGAFFSAIGEDFKTLKKSREIINADVLDAWFDPSPKVTEALHEYLPWIIKTSPPTHSEGLVKTISETRGVSRKCILTGGGSSDLMYLALPKLLNSNSKVLLPNPTYGEYDFIFKNVVNCKTEKFSLHKEKDYQINTDDIIKKLQSKNHDMLLLVNPNSPTGKYLQKSEMVEIIENTPKETIIWIDETYIEYVGSSETLEKVAEAKKNVIICKSMSKVYALSGIRCAYIVSNSDIIHKLAAFSPPWAVSLPAQVAGVNALLDPEYYRDCYEKTHVYRKKLVEELRQTGLCFVTEGVINSVLCEFNSEVSFIIDECRKQGLFIRNVQNMGEAWGNNIARISVKNFETNKRIVGVLEEILK